MSRLPAVGRCRVAGPFGGRLAGWLGFSRPRWEPEVGREGDGQHPAQGPKDSPGCLRCRFEQGDHFGLGKLVLQLAAEAGRLIRHEPDQPAEFSGRNRSR
jgi:hypothetical protein